MDSYNTKPIDFKYRESIKTNKHLLEVISKIDESEKQKPLPQTFILISEFHQSPNLKQYKDTYKKFRKLIKDSPEVVNDESTKPFLEDLLLAFADDLYFAEFKDLKGLYIDLIHIFLKEKSYYTLILQHLSKVWRDHIEKSIEALTPEAKLIENEKWELPMDLINSKVKIMNQCAELLNQDIAKELDDVVNPALSYHILQFKFYLNYIEKSKFSSIKFIFLLSEGLRNALSIVTSFKENILQKLANDDKHTRSSLEIISAATRVILQFIPRLNHDTISQCSLLAVFVDFNLLKQNCDDLEKSYYSDFQLKSQFTGLTHELDEDSFKIKRLAIIRSFAIYRDQFDILKENVSLKSSPYDYVTRLSDEPNSNIKNYSFKTLTVALQSIVESETLRKKYVTNFIYSELFETLLKNWEFPLKGISHQIELLFIQLINILIKENNGKKNEYLIALRNKILSLNVAATKRKYNSLHILIDYISIEDLIKDTPTLVYELLTESGLTNNQTSNTLFEKMFTLLQSSIEKQELSPKEKFEKWTKFWIDDLIKCLKDEGFKVVSGVITYITPILCKINKSSSHYLLDIVTKQDMKKKNNLWCYVSLLKSARENYLIEYDSTLTGYQLKSEIEGAPNKKIDTEFIRQILMNNERNVVLNLLEFITSNPKASDVPAPFEYKLIIEHIQYNLRTSYSDFRNNYLVLIKKFLLRIRNIYDPNLIKFFPPTKNDFTEDYSNQFKDLIAKKKCKPNIVEMLNFLKQIFVILSPELRPDMEFETCYPIIEIFKYIVQIFGLEDFAYRRTVTFKAVSVLNYLKVFTPSLFYFLLNIMKCSWESVRLDALDILQNFPDDFELITPKYLCEFLIPSAMELTKNPVIRNAEGGALVLSFIIRKYIKFVDFSKISDFKNHHGDANTPREIVFAYYVIESIENRFEEVQKSLLEDSNKFASNLIHGLITTLSFFIQHLPKNSKITDKNHSDDFKKFFHVLAELVVKILSYATKLSADNISTCILDNDNTLKKVYEMQAGKTMETDCRGHFISDKPEDPTKVDRLRNVENILYGNTLMESLEDGTGEFDSENLIVVAFYLITRESGLLFQHLANLISFIEEENLSLIHYQDLELMTNTYFHALLNLKHLGSIDRIAQGLSILCKSMYETKNPLLPNLGEKLLNQILTTLETGSFRNVLRRSAGIPPAIICLLKAEPVGNKSRLFPNAMNKLFELSDSSSADDTRVHALNILKFIFQDSNLRSDIESYISQGFITAIKGFSSNDWAIRNSSLILFSSIAKRTLGTDKVSDQHSVKNCMNIIEFFTRAPLLMDYFLNEIRDFLNRNVEDETLYPSLYPIALIMSRLLPYDFKNNFLKKVTDDEEVPEKTEQEIVEPKKFISMEEIAQFLPLFTKASNNKNYMGRLMCARAVLPFVPFEKISEQVINLLEMPNLSKLDQLKKNHNYAHGLLLQIFIILKNHYRLKDNYPKEMNHFDGRLSSVISALSDRLFILTDVRAPFVSSVYLDILKVILKNSSENVSKEIFEKIRNFCLDKIQETLTKETFRIDKDLGHSILRTKYLKFVLTYDRVINKNVVELSKLLESFVTKYNGSLSVRVNDDNELFRTLLNYLNKFLKHIGNEDIKEETKKSIIKNLFTLIFNKEFIATELLQCISESFNIILNLNCLEFIEKEDLVSLLNLLNLILKKYPQNSRLMKPLIKLNGALIPTLFAKVDKNAQPEYLKTYLGLCEEFSDSDQKDFLRIAVIKSLNLSLKSIIDNLTNFSSFVAVSRIVLRLIQDEIPEIRTKMSSFLSKSFETKNSQNLKYNPNYILERYFEHLLDVYLKTTQNNDKEARREYAEFILKTVLESEFDKYFEWAHFEKRIFAVEKPNKYYSTFILRRIAFKNALSLIEKKIINSEEWKAFIESRPYKFIDIAEKNIEKYANEPFYRDEFLFECIAKRFFLDSFSTRLTEKKSEFLEKLKEKKSLLEPYFGSI